MSHQLSASHLGNANIEESPTPLKVFIPELMLCAVVRMTTFSQNGSGSFPTRGVIFDILIN